MNEVTGCAYAVFKDDMVIAEEITPLGDVTVFKAELIAIYNALLWLKNNSKKCKTCCQSGIAAIFAQYITSKLVLEIGNLIMELRQNDYQIEIEWIRGHSDNTGNEYADCLAKMGVEMFGRTSFLSPNIPISNKIIKRRIREAIDRKWDVMWRNHSQCTNTKLFLPTLDRGRQKLLKELSRGSLALLTQIVTGHSYFRAHMWHMYPDVQDIECQICGDLPEEPWHVYNCPLIFFQRQGQGEADETEFKPRQILQYFRGGIIPSIMGSNKSELDRLINKYRKVPTL